MPHASHPRDNGQYAQADPDLKTWFRGLRNAQGNSCCEDADGFRVDDADWRIGNDGNYSVRLNGEWVSVPPYAVVIEHNHVGYALLWIYNGQINCFIPGTQT